MKKDTLIIIGICIILLLASGILFCWKQDSSAGFRAEPAYTENAVSLLAERTPDVTGQEQAGTEECAVYVSGAVKKPGLFRYHGAARVSDAIQASGGFSKGADKNAVNLARLLSDGEQILVPTKKETAKTAKTTESVAGDTAFENRQRVNINTASLEELMTLPGIGQAKAEAVIAYRTEHGSFAKTEDIMNISGIKEGVYNKIKDFIVIT